MCVRVSAPIFTEDMFIIAGRMQSVFVLARISVCVCISAPSGMSLVKCSVLQRVHFNAHGVTQLLIINTVLGLSHLDTIGDEQWRSLASAVGGR